MGGGGDIKDEGGETGSLDKGVQRQRRGDPPCDRERHACLRCLAPFSFSLIQLYRTPVTETSKLSVEIFKYFVV